MEIVFATGNAHKAAEAQSILGSSFAVIMPKELGIAEEIPETGATLEENAIEKCTYLWERCRKPCFADDTGLEVGYLNGRPGVHTARYAGEYADTDENNRKLLAELDGLLLHQRGASFHTVACLALPSGQTISFEGKLDGYIGFGYRGENGFGYDPLFIIKDTTQTLAELTDEEKNRISHRAKAFNLLAEKLKMLK